MLPQQERATDRHRSRRATATTQSCPQPTPVTANPGRQGSPTNSAKTPSRRQRGKLPSGQYFNRPGEGTSLARSSAYCRQRSSSAVPGRVRGTTLISAIGSAHWASAKRRPSIWPIVSGTSIQGEIRDFLVRPRQYPLDWHPPPCTISSYHRPIGQESNRISLPLCAGLAVA